MPRAASAARGHGPSLRALCVLVALLTSLPILALVAYLGWAHLERDTRRVQQDALRDARAVAQAVEAQLTARVEALRQAAEAVAAGAGAAGAVEAQARRLRQTFPDLVQVLVVDPVGALLAAAPGPPEGRRAWGDQDWFQRAATATSGTPFAGELRDTGQEVVVGLYAPARAGDGQLRGVVAADLELKAVQDLLGRARPGEGAVTLLLTGEGIVAARHPPGFVLKPLGGLPPAAELTRRAGVAAELTFPDGETRLVGIVPLRALGWSVAVGFPAAAALGEGRAGLGRVLALGAGWTLLSLGLALALGRRATRGLERLRAAMTRVEAGEIPGSLPVSGGGEVGALTEGFNRMLAGLRAKVREFEALSQVEAAAGAAVAGERAGGSALQDLLRRVVGVMDADAAALLTQEEGGLVPKAAVGFGAIPTDGVSLGRGRGVAGAAIEERQAVLVEDAEEDPRVEEPYLRAAGLRSLVAVPVLSGDRPVGVVEVGYRSSHRVSEGEVQRLEAVARRMAQAIEHERALEAVRRNTAWLEAKLAEQMEALQRAASERAEARRQAEEARRQAEELQQTIRMQLPRVQEVVREKEVVRADPAAEEARRVRAALTRTVSEELRAPLTALLDLPRFLVDGLDKPLDPEERQQLEILHARGEEILELIENLAVLSALHAGELRVARGPVNLAELIQRVVRALTPRAAARGNRIEVDVKPGAGQVVSDARRLEQVLRNLLATSIKYTEVGEIRVTCYRRDAEVVLTVADDGVGFSPEELERIFEPFLQVGPRDGRTLPGTGLLLAVSRRLVESLGGRMRVESEVDRGTWFTVSWPAS